MLSNQQSQLPNIHRKYEKEKKILMNIIFMIRMKHVSFPCVVMSSTVGLANAVAAAYKRIASLLALM